MNDCWREAVQGSRFCAVHGWNQPKAEVVKPDADDDLEEVE